MNLSLTVLDTDFRAIAVLDMFESVIWTDRYSGYGEFELTTPATPLMLSTLAIDRYLALSDSEHLMVIEDIRIRSNPESITKLVITGRSLESILNRRVVWHQTVLQGTFQGGIQTLIEENIISADAERRIDNLVFETSTDEAVTCLMLNAQYDGENLYDIIEKLCSSSDIGFKLTLANNGNLVFKLYAGVDRSYNQIVNPYVIFSPEFENLINSDYRASKKNLKTVAIVKGEGEGISRLAAIVNREGEHTGIARREIYVDGSSISKTTDGGTLSNYDYMDLLRQKGDETIKLNNVETAFEGQMEPIKMYIYGKDFFLGDIVQVVNEYGIGATSRVTEMIYSQDPGGVKIYPTFSMIA